MLRRKANSLPAVAVVCASVALACVLAAVTYFNAAPTGTDAGQHTEELLQVNIPRHSQELLKRAHSEQASARALNEEAKKLLANADNLESSAKEHESQADRLRLLSSSAGQMGDALQERASEHTHAGLRRLKRMQDALQSRAGNIMSSKQMLEQANNNVETAAVRHMRPCTQAIFIPPPLLLPADF